MNRIKNSPLLSIVFAVIISVIILFAAQKTNQLFGALIQPITGDSFYLKNVFFKLILLVFTLIAYALLNKGSFKGLGFQKAEHYPFGKLLLRTALFTIGSLIVGNLIFRFALGNLFPVESTQGFDMPSSLIQLILVVWIWSSFVEEVFVRGLLQGLIQHLKHIRIGKLSVPVIISGLFFGGMHSTLYFAGKDIWFVCTIVFFTSTIGLLAAWYREKYNSLWPAFYVHFFANVIGGIPIIILLLTK